MFTMKNGGEHDTLMCVQVLGIGRRVQKWMREDKEDQRPHDFASSTTAKAIFCHFFWQPHFYSLDGGCSDKEKNSTWGLRKINYKFCLESEFEEKVKHLRVNKGGSSMSIKGY